MTADEAFAKALLLGLAGIVTFTSGATGFVATVPRMVVGAQIPDWLAVVLAGSALTIGTGLFAWVGKMLLEVRDMARDDHRYIKRLMRDVFGEEVDDE